VRIVAVRVKKERAMCANKIPARSFPGSDMAERKRNSTGREVLPAKTLAGGLALREAATEDSIPPHRILRRRGQGEATKPAAAIAGLKPASFTISLLPLLPPIRILYFAESGLLSVTFNRGTVY
jgi:hypothetical protein